MIKNFKNSAAENLLAGDINKEVRRLLPPELHRAAQKKLLLLDSADSLNALAAMKGNRLEKLLGDREGHYSIRINDQYRICFHWVDGHAHEVEIVDYH